MATLQKTTLYDIDVDDVATLETAIDTEMTDNSYLVSEIERIDNKKGDRARVLVVYSK